MAYIEKKITNFEFNTKDISHLGESRNFLIRGEEGAIFSLEIYDDSTVRNYYNFSTGTWSSSEYTLQNIELGGSYGFSINFPSVSFTDATCDLASGDATIDHDDDDGKIEAGMLVSGTGIPVGSTVSSVTSDTRFELSANSTASATNTTLTFSKLKKYTINLYAKTVGNTRTKHNTYIESKNIDGSINVNGSTGSNSNLLNKILYQDVPKNLYISCIAPTQTDTSSGTVNGAISGVNKIALDQDTSDINVTIGDLVTVSGEIATSVHALVNTINPDEDNIKEFDMSVVDSVSDDATITFTPPFNGMTPNGKLSSTGNQSIEISSGETLITPFSITCTAPTGRTFSIVRTPSINDLCAIKYITIGAAALPIDGEDVSSSTYYRWPVSDISGLQEGMILDGARSGTGANTTTPAKISKYISTKSEARVSNRQYATDVNLITVNDVLVPGVDSSNNPVTAIDRNGVITAQEGNIVFDVQQADALKDDANVRIFAYGAEQIKSLTGMDVELNDITATLTQISTTASAAAVNSTTIGITEIGNVSHASTLRGVGVTYSSDGANPTLRNKTAASGAGEIVCSVAQNLQSGQTLFFDNASNIVTITGTIKVSNMSLSDTTLYFDVERFLAAR